MQINIFNLEELELALQSDIHFIRIFRIQPEKVIGGSIFNSHSPHRDHPHKIWVWPNSGD